MCLNPREEPDAPRRFPYRRDAIVDVLDNAFVGIAWGKPRYGGPLRYCPHELYPEHPFG